MFADEHNRRCIKPKVRKGLNQAMQTNDLAGIMPAGLTVAAQGISVPIVKPQRFRGASALNKPPRSNGGGGFGILNPYGDVWTHDWFDTPEEAEAALRKFWGATPFDGFRIIPVTIEVSCPMDRGDLLELATVSSDTKQARP